MSAEYIYLRELYNEINKRFFESKQKPSKVMTIEEERAAAVSEAEAIFAKEKARHKPHHRDLQVPKFLHNISKIDPSL